MTWAHLCQTSNPFAEIAEVRARRVRTQSRQSHLALDLALRPRLAERVIEDDELG